MDPEDKRNLERVLSLTEENHTMLKKVRSVQKTAQMFRAIYWVVIIGSILGAFYFVKPYLDSIYSLYSGLSGTQEKMASFEFPDAKKIKEMFGEMQ